MKDSLHSISSASSLSSSLSSSTSASLNGLDAELMEKIKGIQLRAKFLVNSSFAGEYKSAFRGRGMEFDEIREYQTGDDIRQIDWNVTARNNHPYVKIYKDERELTVMFVVDVSASSQFGSKVKFKNEVAAECCALLAYMALRNNDKVGLIIFSDHVEHYTPPKKGRGHIWQLIRDILTYQSKAKKTDFERPLEFLNQVIKRRAITFLISDFQDFRFEKEVQVTSRRHELIAIGLTDPREIELPSIGFLELEDAETGESLLIDTSDKKFRSQFKSLGLKKLKEQKEFFHAHGIDYIHIKTDESYLNPVMDFLRARERRAR